MLPWNNPLDSQLKEIKKNSETKFRGETDYVNLNLWLVTFSLTLHKDSTFASDLSFTLA